MKVLIQQFQARLKIIDPSFKRYLWKQIDWNNRLTAIIGGSNKIQKQIAGTENAFVAAGNIEYACKNTIPVWMFEFLY